MRMKSAGKWNQVVADNADLQKAKASVEGQFDKATKRVVAQVYNGLDSKNPQWWQIEVCGDTATVTRSRYVADLPGWQPATKQVAA